MVLEKKRWPSPLVLLPPPAGDSGEAQVFGTLSTPATLFEACGRAYHNLAFVKPVASSGKKAGKKGGKNRRSGKDEPELDEEARRKADEALRKKLSRKDIDLDDYYALLGLDDFRFNVTEQQVRRVWKKASLIAHPDKAPPEDRPRAEVKYKAMQKAYETLKDLTKKRSYDSSLPFIDDIPAANQGTTAETFYQVILFFTFLFVLYY